MFQGPSVSLSRRILDSWDFKRSQWGISHKGKELGIRLGGRFPSFAVGV